MSRILSFVLSVMLLACCGQIAISQTVATPTASPAAGTYGTMLQTTLSTTTPGATVYFDGRLNTDDHFGSNE